MANNDFADKFRFLLQQQGLTLPAVARKLGLDLATLNEMMLGKRPAGTDIIHRLASFFQVKPSYFEDRSKQEEEKPKKRSSRKMMDFSDFEYFKDAPSTRSELPVRAVRKGDLVSELPEPAAGEEEVPLRRTPGDETVAEPEPEPPQAAPIPDPPPRPAAKKPSAPRPRPARAKPAPPARHPERAAEVASLVRPGSGGNPGRQVEVGPEQQITITVDDGGTKDLVQALIQCLLQKGLLTLSEFQDTLDRVKEARQGG